MLDAGQSLRAIKAAARRPSFVTSRLPLSLPSLLQRRRVLTRKSALIGPPTRTETIRATWRENRGQLRGWQLLRWPSLCTWPLPSRIFHRQRRAFQGPAWPVHHRGGTLCTGASTGRACFAFQIPSRALADSVWAGLLCGRDLQPRIDAAGACRRAWSSPTVAASALSRARLAGPGFPEVAHAQHPFIARR